MHFLVFQIFAHPARHVLQHFTLDHGVPHFPFIKIFLHLCLGNMFLQTVGVGPGQALGLQESLSMDCPLHTPISFSTTNLVLVRVFVPSPQVVEQDPHSLQMPHTQSIAGQAMGLQESLSMDVPLHTPSSFSTTNLVLVRVFVPFPQVLEQVPHSLQMSHIQFIAIHPHCGHAVASSPFTA